jgi:NADH-quinone oxidoreductase subunit M
MPDLNAREIGLLLPLVALMVWLGMGPAPFLARSEAAVQSLLTTSVAKARAVRQADDGVAVVVPVRWPEAVATAPVPAATTAPAAAGH